jgi:hypothetical protein
LIAERFRLGYGAAMTRLFRFLAVALLMIGLPLPVQAAVTITFWSHDFKDSFPHTFFTLRGVPDAGGAAVDANYGFTAKSISPALLWGTVPGRIDIADAPYMAGSDAQFALVLTDAQYAAVVALVREWDEKLGDGHYNLNRRNCVHFVQEAARRVGLTGLDQPKLMKKPRSFLLAVEAANAGHVTVINQRGQAYLATLTPVTGGAVSTTSPTMPPRVSTTAPAALTPTPATAAN